MVDVLAQEELTVDGLCGSWTMEQRARGHRHSTDDLLTAWYACEKTSSRTRLLDLGSGIGTVGLMTLWRSPDAMLTAVEAQELSFALLVRNIARNGLEARVRAVHGDLRHVRFPGETFDVVTGSPPYFNVKDGIVPQDSQKAHARFELRGDVTDYCAAAVAALAPGGAFVFCFPTAQRQRALVACAAAGLHVWAYRDVVPREGLPALFTLFHCGVASSGAPPTVVETPYLVRHADGSQSAQHAAARASFGLGLGRG